MATSFSGAPRASARASAPAGGAVRALALALLCWACLWAAAARAQQMPLRYHTQQDGLGSLTVTALEMDRDGYMWIGTENGLYRYNGASFERFGEAQGLDVPYVSMVRTDGAGRLWVGTGARLYLMTDGRARPVLSEGRQLPVYPPAQNMSAAPGGQRYVVSARRLYALGEDGAAPRARAVFSDQQIAREAGLGRINSVHADPDGTLWLGCGSALCRAGPDGVTVWSAARGVPVEVWRHLLRDRHGQLWARGERHIIALPANGARFVDRTPPGRALRKFDFRSALVEDRQGRILSDTDGGLARWDGRRWEQFGAADGLRAGGGVTALLPDHAGGMWLGSAGLGLIHWQGYGNWANWTAAQGLPDDVLLSFQRDGAGALYAGTRSGAARLAPDARRFVPAAPGQRHHQWSGMALDRDGAVWAGTYSGMLLRLPAGGAAQVVASKLPVIRQMLIDHRRRLWLATNGGLYVADPARPAAPARRRPAPGGGAEPETLYNGLCEGADHSLWFLTDHHLLRLDGERWSARPLGEELDDVGFNDLACAADGAVWLAGAKTGLWRAVAGAGGIEVTRVTAPLLDGVSIVGLYTDRRGWLWVGTGAGVAVWNRDHWRWFDQGDGLVWNDTNGSIFYEDDDGSMWIATSNGASHLRRPELLFAPQPLSVGVGAVRRDGVALPAGPALRLAWSAAPLDVTLSSQDFQNRGGLRYHYRLAGLEERWTSSAAPVLRYTALPPGDYRLDYYVTDAYHHNASTVRQLPLTILPPWWRSTPMYLLYAALAALLLLTVHRLRVRQLMRRQQYQDLRQRALKDSLTSAWNRGAMLEIIGRELERAARLRQPLLLVLLDLDHFKRVNDTYGHPAGDAVLKEVVARLHAAVRLTDSVGRYGGEEFIVLLPGLDRANGHGRVEALRRAIGERPIAIDAGRALPVTGSFGVAAFEPLQPLPLAEMIAHADQALYRCKEHGRNRIEYAAPV